MSTFSQFPGCGEGNDSYHLSQMKLQMFAGKSSQIFMYFILKRNTPEKVLANHHTLKISAPQ